MQRVLLQAAYNLKTQERSLRKGATSCSRPSRLRLQPIACSLTPKWIFLPAFAVPKSEYFFRVGIIGWREVGRTADEVGEFVRYRV